MRSFFRNRLIATLFLLFWGGYIALFGYLVSVSEGEKPWFWLTVCGAAFHLGAIVINLELLIPRLLAKNKTGAYAIALVGMVLVVVVLRTAAEQGLYQLFGLNTSSLGTWQHNLSVGLSVSVLLAFFTMLKFSIDWFEQEKNRRVLEREKMAAELNYLKAQINPHFFFNTLNNLYSLAIKNAPETPDAILKLSELMRYTLYESAEPRVLLQRDIVYLKSFIDLQLLRMMDNLEFLFSVKGDTENRTIEPMLLLPFVENAFKHARRNEAGFFIHVDLEANGHWLNMKVSNTHMPNTTSARKHSSGIGLENVRRRLELLYPKAHTLQVHESSGVYSISLSLNMEPL